MAITLLETNDKCRNVQCPTPQQCKGSSPNHRREVKLVQKKQKKWLDDELGD
jgi:hypothetical protein